ncbi:transglutaminase-like cysteine peptidase [Pararhizobium sp. A13]|uniref:transglutaminase-like cysteine peptidase n=1 Tax=Pararhizobium sp. A13 TaxID=3133975 RepID=UPI00311B3D61
MSSSLPSIVLVGAILLAISAAPATSSAPNAKTSLVPIAFSLYCLDHLEECKPSEVKAVNLTPRVEELLLKVNNRVNNDIKPAHEKFDTWTLNPRMGDCDDYVMTKRSRLIHAGIPPSALEVAVVKTPAGEGHAVLFVKTSAGELVLDNLRTQIVRRSQIPYRVLSVT